ncbi:DUF2231 domain-containing protein [Gordonia sp. NPDC003376]
MDTIRGLPAHPLFVHLTVVVIPLAAILGLLAVLWPAARRRLGWFTPLVALVAMIATPLTTSAGEALEKVTPKTPDLEHHTELGGMMIGWVAPLFVTIVLFWALHEEAIMSRLPVTVSPGAARIASIVLGAGVIVTAIGSIVMIYLVGDSGAQSVWAG